jgi:quinoprotein glucose dehydrogenase
MDIPCAPMLIDITVNGQPVKALAQPTKQSILYVFNRVTGQPIWPIEEKPVPPGDVPGEWYSPTQPIPTKPPPYGRNGFSVDDVIDFTPELKDQGLQLISKYKIGPLFTPPVVSKAGGPLGTLDIGCCQGGTNWAGGSYDPQTHLLYVYGKSEVASLGLVPPAGGVSDMNFVRGSAASDGARSCIQRVTSISAPASSSENNRISAGSWDRTGRYDAGRRSGHPDTRPQ